MAETYNPGREQVQVTAAPNLQTERARMDPNGSVNQLIEALGADNTQRELAVFNRVHDDNKLREQQVKFDWYVQQFQQDHAGGAVSQAQVKSRFPETVPVIAARIAEAIGQNEGKKQFQSVIEEISGNDSLRLDTAARATFLAKKRAEIAGTVGEGNDFYGAGIVGAMDKLTSQYETNWASETAAYHQKVQGEQFSAEVVEGLNQPDPRAALLALDAKYSKSSSLNNLERNKLVVASAIDHAFAADDAKLLDSIPPRFLNADTKAAIEKTRLQIQDRRMTNWRMGKELERDRRETTERNGRIEIIQGIAAGQPVDPAKYASNPDLYAFANSAREMPKLPEAESAGNVQKMETRIWTEASAGKSLSMQQYTDQIVADRTINPKDKAPLIAKLEKLMEGTAVMKDEVVRQTFTDRIGPSLHALENSPAYTIYRAAGRNVRAEVVKGFDLELRRLWQAEFEEKGAYPTGHRKVELIDRATDRAELQIQNALNPKTAAAEVKGKSPAITNNPAATAKPSPALPPGVKKLN